MKYSEAELELFANIAGNFPKLREFLQARYDAHAITIVQKPDGDALHARGRAAELLNIIELLDVSRDALAKMRTARR